MSAPRPSRPLLRVMIACVVVLTAMGASGAGAQEPTSTLVPEPTNPLPPETLPPETLPPETLPPVTAPPATAPPQTAPPETLPPETLPPETTADTTPVTTSTIPPTTVGSDDPTSTLAPPPTASSAGPGPSAAELVDPAQERLQKLSLALIILAAMIAISTLVFWRVTRPARIKDLATKTRLDQPAPT